jgi:hypothetical protein
VTTGPGHIYDPRTEPTAIEWELAYALGRTLPLTRSPVQHRTAAIVSYREGILEMLDALTAKWADMATLDADFSVRARAAVYALELQEVIDVVRGNVPGRTVRLVVKGRDQHEQP